jgi:osmotically-inducible protein OsmY
MTTAAGPMPETGPIRAFSGPGRRWNGCCGRWRLREILKDRSTRIEEENMRAPIIAAAALLVLACAEEEAPEGVATGQEETEQVTPSPEGPTFAAPERTDGTIAANVENEIIYDPAVSLADVTVVVTNGIATLSGTVDNILARERAARIAETVKGVRSVVNDIDVEAYWGLTDEQIRKDAENALLMDPATDSWQVEVTVTDNVAALTGEVDSWQEKRLAGTVVKGVRGVEGLSNDIEVEQDAARSDEEIETEIEEILSWDVLVDDALIDVEVQDGEVTLSGTVGSASEKYQAWADAWVQGVESVTDEDLEVEYWARDEALRKDKYVAKEDAEIREAVEDAMFYDPRVNSAEVTTRVDEGVVTLRGTVESIRARRAAESDARNTVGVVRVKNRLQIEEATVTAEQIEQRVTDGIAFDPYLERYEISVNAVNGDVYLSGVVDSYFEKSRADLVASNTPGVEEIHNNLSVEDEETPIYYDPYVYEYNPYLYPWYDYEPARVLAPDEDIEYRILEEMWWSPWVDVDDVTVEVDDSVATLGGTVDTLLERNKAVEEAFEGGATWVYNDIEVE